MHLSLLLLVGVVVSLFGCSSGASQQPEDVGIVFLGREDVALSAYNALSVNIQNAITSDYGVVSHVVVVDDVSSIPMALSNLTTMGVSQFFFVGHSMTSAGIDIQNFAKTSRVKTLGVILIAGFLQRIQRPDIVSCLPKAVIQPQITWQRPLGVLQDGVHDCYGPNVPQYPIPTLTIGGELDGVVRVARIAEAYYTQVTLANKANDLPVVVVPGLNHASLLDTTNIPGKVLNNDLRAEITPAQARSQVAEVVSSFIGQQLGRNTGSSIQKLVVSTGSYLQNLINSFVIQEGNWFFTGGDDEHGSSAWAAQAQIYMSDPLPSVYTWTTHNQFRLLSDEENIPPYYRPKHRPEVDVAGSNLNSTTVTQLRFIELTLIDVDAGLNGWGIIKEEKLNILTALPDDGSVYVSAIEIATKLMSRQKLFNITGHDSPDSLDDGNRCAAINQLAYNWAFSQLPPTSLSRWNKYGVPFLMGDDLAPFPDAGPFWIWKYMSYVGDQSVTVSAPYAFFSLSADPYGAGNHYCKLLSPARVFEWMLTDGLRANYGLTF